jgi:hypothetical protein
VRAEKDGGERIGAADQIAPACSGLRSSVGTRQRYGGRLSRLRLRPPAGAALGLGSERVERRGDRALPRSGDAIAPPRAERPEVGAELAGVRERRAGGGRAELEGLGTTTRTACPGG